MMDFQIWKQRREEMMREAEQNRLARELQAARRKRARRTSALIWELKRHAGRLHKLLRASMKDSQE